MQDLGDLIPALLEIKARENLSMRFHLRLELGDGAALPNDEVVSEVNEILKDLGGEYRVV
jgi:hypothetical protein